MNPSVNQIDLHRTRPLTHSEKSGLLLGGLFLALLIGAGGA